MRYYFYVKDGQVSMYSSEKIEAPDFEEIAIIIDEETLTRIKNNEPFYIENGQIIFITN